MTNAQLIKNVQSGFVKSDMPEVRTGMEVEVTQKITEGDKTRLQKYRGLVIKTAGKTDLEKTFTVRRTHGGHATEKIFPVNGPTVEKIEVIREFKVRRSFISFIRGLAGKAARLKEKQPKPTKK